VLYKIVHIMFYCSYFACSLFSRI